MLLILALRRQKQVDFCEFKASLIYPVDSRLTGYIVKPYLKKWKKEGAEEMAQRLRALADLAEDLGSIPSTYTAANNHL